MQAKAIRNEYTGPMPAYISFILLAIGIGYVEVNEWASVVEILKQHQQFNKHFHPSIHPLFY